MNLENDSNTEPKNESPPEKFHYDRLVGRSPEMQEVYRTIDRIVNTDLNVILQGETGTGKELIARAIHHNGPRAEKPFLAINCGRLTDTLLESELFGHQEGAFTGAAKEKTGLFEQADGGTLFLDELPDMSSNMQSNLLRVLETGEVRKLGGEESRSVDVRLICSTNRRLKPMLSQGDFREDLYYRLRGAIIQVPPLRDRKEDIPLLINHFLDEYAEEQGVPKKECGEEIIREFMQREWPGNVRELRTKIRQMAAFALEETEIRMTHLQDSGVLPDISSSTKQDGITIESTNPLKRVVKEAEEKAIRRVLEQVDGDKQKAAEMLEISSSSLYMKLKEYGIDT